MRGPIRRRLHRQIFVGMLVVGIFTALLAGLVLRSLGYVPPVEHQPDPLRALVAWLCAGTGLGLGSHWMARRITRRLVALQRSVTAWGQGDLAARACVVGEDEVAQLGRAWNEAATRVEALMASRARVLAHASHELRSPLARLRLALAFAEEGRPFPAEALAEALRDVAELDALIEELLLSGRLEGAPLQGAEVDLYALAVVEAERVGATVQGPGAVAWGDRRLLTALLRNLLENARRYGAGSPIEVGVEGGAAAPSLWVADRGPGVPEGARSQIFAPFMRLPGHSESEGGVGLGLALVDQIARHHGGDVICEERPGGGSLFRLRLPPVPRGGGPGRA